MTKKRRKERRRVKRTLLRLMAMSMIAVANTVPTK